MKTVYLAGPITGLHYDGATDWRDWTRQQLDKADIHGLCPLRGKDYLAKETSLADTYDQYVYSTGHAISIRDRWDAMRCDAMLVNLIGATKVSIGTVLEIGMAATQLKPIVICMEPGNPHDHAMVRGYAYVIVPNLQQGIDTTKFLLGR